MTAEMSSMDRVMTSLQHKEPDRVPLLMALTMHGSKLYDMSIERYYSDPNLIADAQLRFAKMYGNDFVNPFTHASSQVEPFGGSTIFYEDGPPNSGEPTIRALEDIEKLEVPDYHDAPSIRVTLEATKILKKKVGNDVPIVGVVISPFSLPVMQMGFEDYFDLMFTDQRHFEMLMKVNLEFTVQLANALFDAGSTAIVYFDPLSSTTIIPREKFIETGFKVAKSFTKAVKGPVMAHYASGRILPIIDKIVEMGVLGVGVSVDEDLAMMKRAAGQRLTLVGNLNGVEMPTWTKDQVEASVKEAIAKGAHGGGFVLSDNHGEIPYQVKDETLGEIAAAARKYGTYPIGIC